MRVCHQCGAGASEDDRFCSSCGATLPEEGSSGSSDPLVGRMIGGSYTLQEIIGVGGMGRVYRAEQGTLGRTVAIKVIHPHLLNDEQTVARFYTEARASSRLNHPNSVSIFDFGRTDDGILFLAMEFLKGKDLALVMHEEGPLTIPRIADIMLAVLDALGEAHALDIVHRDLKPENIIMRRFRSGGDLVKVVDFGLATIVDGQQSITRPGLVCGTPDYMSPEQGRGDAVDGRGDLYAMGVMLFELLTDQLPFADDTPTKVVLRHINDPVPDPRRAAPQRSIPDGLAEVTMKALAKDRDDRYQSAKEMADAIREAMRDYRAGQKATVTCGSCGTENPSAMSFCGACGQRLTGTVATVVPASRPISRPSFYPQGSDTLPIVGRGAELATLESLRQRAGQGPVWVHVVGEPGVGKSRLLAEIAGRSANGQDLVVGAGPHPTGAPVSYGPIRQIVAFLMETEVGDLAGLVDAHEDLRDPLVRAGLEELVEPRGLVGSEGGSRAGAVAAALAAVFRNARARTGADRVVILVDDLPRCDSLSRTTLERLPGLLPGAPLFLVTAGAPERHGPPATEELVLEGFTSEEASEFLARDLGEEGGRPSLRAPAGRHRILPLYLQQLEALAGSGGVDEVAPPRLADAVAQRLERLGVGARRILQAASVLGSSCSLAVLRDVGSKDDMGGLDELAHKGLISIKGMEITIAHPFIAELVEAFIPAEARNQLHQRALDVLMDVDSPREVLAEHAFRSGEAMGSLMVLERMGDGALDRGDPEAAILAFRRALEMARREMLETADPMMDAAIFTFSRKLGAALERAGDYAGADGVLREAMDLTGPTSSDRAKMYLALGKVAARRERTRDANRLFGKALELVAGIAPEIESFLQLEIGRVRCLEGAPAIATNAYRRALELFEELQSPARLRALATIELGQALGQAGEVEEAHARLEAGGALAHEAGALALAARALGARGELLASAGEAERADALFEEAERVAAEAGDAEAVDRWALAAAHAA